MAGNPHVDEANEREFGKILTRRKAPGPMDYLQSSEVATAKSKDLRKPTPQNQPFFPGDFEIIECNLRSPHKSPSGFIDLRQAFSSLNIYESLYSPTLRMDIRILDGVGMEEILPIIGEETISLKIKTRNIEGEQEPISGNTKGTPGEEEVVPGPFADSSNMGLLDLHFCLYKMTDREEQNQQHGITEYTLHGVSTEYIDNLKTRVQRSTMNPITREPQKISTVVRNLFREIFRWSSADVTKRKKIFIEPTKNLVKLVTPNMNPFKTFDFLASRAVSAGQHAIGSSFIFFETVTGFFFISIETLFAGGGLGYQQPADDPVGSSPDEGQYMFSENRSKETYTLWPKTYTEVYEETGKKKEDQTAMEMTSVEQFEFISNFDVLDNLAKGMYANKLMTHDLVRMKYDTVDFNYMDKDLQRKENIVRTDGSVETKDKVLSAQDKKNFTDQFAHLEKSQLCSNYQKALGGPQAHISFYPTNFAHNEVPHFAFGIGSKTVKHGSELGALNIIPNRVEQWMQQRIAQNQLLNNIKIFLRAPGRSTRMVGDLIDFKLPSPNLHQRGGFKEQDTHKYLSGKYLITKLRHHFTAEKYMIEFEAVKDSFRANLPQGVQGSSAIQDDGTIKMSEDGTRVIGGL